MSNYESNSLPHNYMIHPYDVICARGKNAINHSGNRHYRTLIQHTLQRYSKARSKYEKTIIVTELIDKIKEKSPHGGFIKKNPTTKIYYQVSDHFSREKVGQNLRDSLGFQYKSSTKAKQCKRKRYNATVANNVESIIRSNHVVVNHMNELSNTLQYQCQNDNYDCIKSSSAIDIAINCDSSTTSSINGCEDTEYYINQLFIKTNRDILEALKKDHGLLQEFTQAEKSNK